MTLSTCTVDNPVPGGGQPVTHLKLNRIIAGIGALYAVIIVAAVFFGPISSPSDAGETENTPGFEESVSDDATPHNGVGGVPAERSEINGTVTDSRTGEALSGVSVVAEDDGTVQDRVHTGADGSFLLENVPETSTISFSMDGYHTETEAADAEDEFALELASKNITGRVVSAEGSPIQGASVASGAGYTRSIENGAFELNDVPPNAQLTVKAAGYQSRTIPRDDFNHGFTLTPETIQGVYAPSNVIGDEQTFSELLDMIDRTELNAITIDIKDINGTILYDSQVPTAQEIGAVDPAYDVESVIEQLKERDIHAIARLVVFEDPALAESRPELAIEDTSSGNPWETWQGRAWANPYNSDVWDYNVEIMQEAIDLGFDEIQLSHVRFPDSGPLNRADYGVANSSARRQQAIAGFLDHTYAATASSGAMLSADIFAMALWDENEMLTGQDLQMMIERLDYVHPLLFPSHFREGSLGYDSPSAHPSEITGRTLESGLELLPDHYEARLRPWLQAFSYGSAMPFGEDAIRAQIDAARQHGVSGWMLWNSEGAYPEGVLGPGE